MTFLSCEILLVIDHAEAYRVYEVGPFIVYLIRGDLRPLDDLPYSSISQLKSPAMMIRWFWWR